jgi:structure-specific endonuclease subunit SLX1
MDKPSFVYLLESTDGGTYIGATIDLDQRLRKHNKIIKGGARATGKKVDKGQQWTRICYIEGCPNWTTALQVEWRWKHISRRLPIRTTPTARRMEALDVLLNLERPTSKAMPYTDWNPKVVMAIL